MNTSALAPQLQSILHSERFKFLTILKFTAAGMSGVMLLLRLPFLQTLPNFSLWYDGINLIGLSVAMVLLWAVWVKNNKLFRMRRVTKKGLEALSLLTQTEEGSGLMQLMTQQPQPLKVENLMTIQKTLGLTPIAKGAEIEV